jgi:hypothetical protein
LCFLVNPDSAMLAKAAFCLLVADYSQYFKSGRILGGRDGKGRSVLARPDRSPTEPDAPEPDFSPAGRAGRHIYPGLAGLGRAGPTLHKNRSRAGPVFLDSPGPTGPARHRPDFGPTLSVTGGLVAFAGRGREGEGEGEGRG